MFGYVRAYKPELTFSQYDVYKGVYCSLCKEIGEHYGFFARITLSYDFAFFALVRMAISEKCPGFKKSRCSYNPLKKCLKCGENNEDMSLTSHISMLAVYYKYLDNLEDSGSVKKFLLKVLSPYFKHIYKKAKMYAPMVDRIFYNMHIKQAEIENNFNGNIDSACHPSADALGKLLSLDNKDELIYKFGYLLGRWVYLIDAVDDFQKDKKSNSFNPFLNNDSISFEKADEALNLTAGEAACVFEEIKFYRYKKIISNVLYDGLNFSQEIVIERGKYEKSI